MQGARGLVLVQLHAKGSNFITSMSKAIKLTEKVTEAKKRMASLTETETETEPELELNKEEEAYAKAMQLTTCMALPMSIRGAIELGIFEVIAKAGEGAKLSASEIAAQIQSKNADAPTMLDGVLRILATHSVLDCSVFSGVRAYSLAPVSKYFVTNQDGVAPLNALVALMTDKVFLDSWYQLKDAIVEGGVPFDRVHGMNSFEYTKVDPRFNEVFNTANNNKTCLDIKKILEAYNGFEHIKQLVDVGGNLGVTLKSIISKYPHIKGINFDLPHVVQHAQNHPGVEHVGGDMFRSVPKGDAIFMKSILHAWSDEHCLKLLKNCHESINKEDGKLIAVEAVLPDLPENSAASKANSQIDVFMFTHSPGGKVRTKLEFINLATAAGFSGIRFQRFVCNSWVMEFYK